MTISKIVALLSVIALLASLPLSVALAQQPPFRVVGTASLDGEPAAGSTVVAMVGDEMVGMGMVDEDGMFQVDLEGEMDSMVMFTLKMGEGEEAMEYMASTMDMEGMMTDVMIGMMGDVEGPIMLGAYTDPANVPPTAVPTKTAEEQMEAMRGPRGRRGAQGDPGPRAGHAGRTRRRTGPPARTATTAMTARTAPPGADGARTALTAPTGAPGARRLGRRPRR